MISESNQPSSRKRGSTRTITTRSIEATTYIEAKHSVPLWNYKVTADIEAINMIIHHRYNNRSHLLVVIALSSVAVWTGLHPLSFGVAASNIVLGLDGEQLQLQAC